MIILVVHNQETDYTALVNGLRKQNKVQTVDHPATAMEYLQERSVDVVIVDEQLAGVSGIEFLQELVQVNPLLNTALVSALSAEEFHEATEGLGVLMQLPLRPDVSHAEELLTRLDKINQMMTAGAGRL